jgi:hypothetical protein
MSKPDDNGTTQRMQTVAGLQPVYSPGEFVYLNSAMPGFPDGTRFKVVVARSIGTNQYRYELQANGQTVWVLEADLRTSPPISAGERPEPSRRDLSMTQRMQTMTLSQRMSALGLDNEDAGATQRLRILDAGVGAPPTDGPVTGEPGFNAGQPRPEDKKPDGK